LAVTKSPADTLLERVRQSNSAAERLEKATKRLEELSEPTKQMELYVFCRVCTNYFTRWHPTIPAQIICKCGSTRCVVLTIDGRTY